MEIEMRSWKREKKRKKEREKKEGNLITIENSLQEQLERLGNELKKIKRT